MVEKYKDSLLRDVNINQTVYLKSNFDVLCERAFWKYRLHAWNNGGADHSSIRANGARLLADAGHDGKVLRDFSRQYASNALLQQIVCTFKICKIVNSNQDPALIISTVAYDNSQHDNAILSEIATNKYSKITMLHQIIQSELAIIFNGMFFLFLLASYLSVYHIKTVFKILH